MEGRHCPARLTFGSRSSRTRWLYLPSFLTDFLADFLADCKPKVRSSELLEELYYDVLS